MRTGTAPVQLALNAEKGSAAGIVQSYAARILAAYARELAADSAQRRACSRRRAATGAGAHRRCASRSWYNPTLNYQHYMVPGILVALVTMIGTLLTAQNIAREKELGTLEQLNVTPITRGQFITAKLLPFWVLALVDLALGLVVGRLRLRHPDARQPRCCSSAPPPSIWSSRSASGCGSRRWSTRSSRRCSSRSSS